MEKLGIALIYITNNRYAYMPLYNEFSANDITENICEKLNLTNNIVGFETESSTQNNKKFKTYKCKPTIYNLLKEINDKLKNCENIMIIYADSPFTGLESTKKLWDMHYRYKSEYSYTENYPDGYGVEFLSEYTLKKLVQVASGNDEPLTKTSISKLINFDINAYDVEVDISNIDLRKERLSLYADCKRNYLSLKMALEYIKKNPIDLTFDDLMILINEYPQFMRQTPSYIEIELTNDCKAKCISCPRNKMTRNIGYMDLDKYRLFLKNLNNFVDEAVIAFTYMGEPTLHPNFTDFIVETSKYKGFRLIVETSAYALFTETLHDIINNSNNPPEIIFSLDASNEQLYNIIRKDSNFENAEANASYYLKNNPEKSYLQVVKSKDNNEDTDNFFTRWRQYKDRIVVQQYNDYRKNLLDKKIIDLSPINRFACWHLQRDLNILYTGDVIFCKQDYDGERIIGNVFEEDIASIWKKLENYFIEDHKGNINKFCENCTEWFTFNF